MEKKYLILSLCLSFILAFALPAQVKAQQLQTVQGTIVDEKGDPIIGGTVKILDGNSGTITDFNGHFNLKVPLKAKLIISYVGYISQTISDLNNPRIVLKEDVMKLDEVVVVGYGEQKMKSVTGSVSTISTKDISDLSTSNLGASLTGIVNGLSVSGGSARPGEAASLTVRQSSVMQAYSGTSGYVPDPSPLYIIDDFVCPDATLFNNLDASMVESITVLKDASAAVYGSRAAQGVILVKTKRGKEGAPKITYSGQFGYNDAVSQPKMLNAYNYGVIWNGVKGSPTTDGSAIDHTHDLFQADELATMKNLNYNLLNDYWKPALSQKHSINISGGSDKTTYFAGMSYFTQSGNLSWLNYNRWNYRAGMDTKIKKWLKASLQVSGDYGTTEKGQSKIGTEEVDYNTLLTHPRYIPDYINGLPIIAYGTSNTLVNSVQYYNYKAIQNLNNYSKTSPQNVNINTALEYDFGWNQVLKGLKLKMTYSKYISTSKNDVLATYIPVYQMITRGGSGNHLYTGDLSSSNFNVFSLDNGNLLSRTTSRTDNYQLNFYATYARKFGLHDLSALFTIEKAESETEDLFGSVTYPLSFTNGQSLSVGGNSAQTTQFTRSESGMLSYVTRVNYSYADKYLAEFLFRTDASTKFSPDNYWGYFPSLSLGWVMSEESWFKNHIHGIDFFKLRGSAGILGKDNIAYWTWLQTYSAIANKGAVFGTSTTTNMGYGMNSSAAPNVNAHWDTSYNTNLGVDLRMLNDKLAINLDGYYNMGRNIFMTRTGSIDFPTTVGTQPTAENFGSIDAYGIELSVGWKDKIGKDFKYFVKLSTGYSDNKVLKKYWPTLITIDGQHPNQRTDLGTWGLDCLGIFRSYQQINEYVAKYHITNYLGLSPSQIRPGMLIYKDVRGAQNSDGSYQAPDGKIDATNDIVQISKRSSNPYGFTTNLGGEWKGISFTAQITANWGGYTLIDKSARSGYSSISSANSTSGSFSDLEYVNVPSFWANNMYVYQNVLDGQGNIVAAQNLDAKYPNMRYAGINSQASTFWAVSSTRIYLRTVTVAYSLPRKLIKNLQIESCRLNLSCQNVLSLYNPYPDNYTDPMAGTYGNYPTLRTISLGVNVSF
jgi:TonB-linked SusC/RagA family outer membrane protein